MTDDPVFRLLSDGRTVHLVLPYVVADHRGGRITVPAGFESDFASVPRMFWRMLPPWGPYSKAAIVHDYLYRTGTGTRKYADDVFDYRMNIDGVSTATRLAMYWAVRMFASGAWRGIK